MRDRASMEEASRQFIDAEFRTSAQKTIAQLAFYEGADWAIDTLWHKPTEEMPECNVSVLCMVKMPHIHAVPTVLMNVGGKFPHPGVVCWSYLPALPEYVNEEV